MTYDLDRLLYNDAGRECFVYPAPCGGLISFEIALGDRLTVFPSWGGPLVVWDSETTTSFTGYNQVFRFFDSFSFHEGSFRGVDADNFDDLVGEGDVWVQVPSPVPEPAPLALLALSLIGVGLRRYRKTRMLLRLPAGCLVAKGNHKLNGF